MCSEMLTVYEVFKDWSFTSEVHDGCHVFALWRYKVLSKTLAPWLREVMAKVAHPNQTYCVPDKLISDNILIWHVLDVSSSLDFRLGKGIWPGWRPVSREDTWAQLLLYSLDPGIFFFFRDVAVILKIKSGLAAPFAVQRGGQQGCPLSGMLYSLAFEPLLHFYFIFNRKIYLVFSSGKPKSVNFLNFIPGLSKMGIYKSWKKRAEDRHICGAATD